MKKTLVLMLLFIFLSFNFIISSLAAENDSLDIPYELSHPTIEVSSKSAVLMEAETGEILFAKNENEALPPASVTKIMTLLLVMEAIEDGRISPDATIPISAHAASMGGSQVFLKEGEYMSVLDLIKCTVIASANDAAVALSEYLYGSESAFVNEMNKKAAELGMNNTVFENTTGLDDTVTEHLTSAKDIAIMSRELIKHDLILKYSSLWQDTIRGGEFTLTNTNRLVRYYDGCNGLKTGSTDKAGYCISATAEREGTKLIAVVMGAETRDERNSIAKSLLDLGFSNYALYKESEKIVDNIPVYGANVFSLPVYSEQVCVLINKSHKSKVEKIYSINEYANAPISKGEVVGTVKYYVDGKLLCEKNLYLNETVEKLTVKNIFSGILRTIFSGNFNK